jgi:partner of Y14 and mago
MDQNKGFVAGWAPKAAAPGAKPGAGGASSAALSKSAKKNAKRKEKRDQAKEDVIRDNWDSDEDDKPPAESTTSSKPQESELDAEDELASKLEKLSV